MGVCKYLDLSTSHLSAMGRLFLANPEKFEKQGEVVVCPKSYGWIILYWEEGCRVLQMCRQGRNELPV